MLTVLVAIFVQPFMACDKSEMVYTPLAPYVCDGAVNVSVGDASPQFQVNVIGLNVVLLTVVTVLPQGAKFATNAVLGVGNTVMKITALSFTLQVVGSITTKETVYDPTLVYVKIGFVVVELVWPVPKYQT